MSEHENFNWMNKWAFFPKRKETIKWISSIQTLGTTIKVKVYKKKEYIL
jgi:hypothetical protein